MKGFIISCKSSWKSKPPTLIPNKPLPPEASCIAKSLKRCFVQSLSVASTLAVAGLQIEPLLEMAVLGFVNPHEIFQPCWHGIAA